MDRKELIEKLIKRLMRACEEDAEDRHMQDALSLTMTSLYLEYLRVNPTIHLSLENKTDFDHLVKILVYQETATQIAD